MKDNTEKKRKLAKIMAQLRVTYMHELPDRLSGMEELVLKLEQGDDFTNNYETLFRNIHSLKGSGGTFGYPIITTICHQMEDLLGDVSDSHSTFFPDSVDTLLQYVDLLRQIPTRYESGDTELTGITADLHSLQHGARDGRNRCLVVEGSATTREMISLVLSEEQAEISHAADGFEALERLMQEKFDLLITGMAIGGLNGKALIAAIRLSDSVNADIPTILLTTSETSPHAPSLSADIVISKGPGMPKILQESCHKLL